MQGLIDIKLPDDQEVETAVILKWLKQVGDSVEANEPIVEVETDKVSLEVSAPGAGVLREILYEQDDEITMSDVLGRIESDEAAAHSETPAAAVLSRKRQIKRGHRAGGEGRLSPAVRRLLKEHDIDSAELKGTGAGGRITSEDVLAYVESGQHKVESHGGTSGIQSHLIPHDTMRETIARRMVDSLRTAPHVTTIFEADMSAVIAHRKAHRAEYAEKGVRLTFTAYFVEALVHAIKAIPAVNSCFHDDHVEIFDDINIGVATSLGDHGVIVPVVHQAQDLDLFAIASKLQEYMEKAATKNLAKADVSKGTVTISNHGVTGSLLATPIIINQPQSAILGIGKLEKRVVVIEEDGEEKIVVRPKLFVTLSIDHRVLDAFQANTCLRRLVNVLEGWGE